MKVIRSDGSIIELSFEQEEGREAFQNTSAIILAYAVKRLYPKTKCAIGSIIENGFYYDFDFDFDFTVEHLKLVEKEIENIIKLSIPIEDYDMKKADALEVMKSSKEWYKLQIIQELTNEESIHLLKLGDYFEVCKRTHVSNACIIKAFKLTTIAGAYWRGNENNKMLTRIYGTSFPSKGQLDSYLKMQEEIKHRDHRRIGKELQLFSFTEEGPGFPFFLPNGMVILNLLKDYWRRLHIREGYVEISTPLILNRELWENSGHWEHYRTNMYTTNIDEQEYAIKPMNCPGGMLVYKMSPHSYRELPLRIGELGLAHRHEKSGTLHGLMRARCFTQDDAHIFMMPEQISHEIKGVIRLIDEVHKKFGFEYRMELSTRPETSIGSAKDWEMATNALKSALDDMNYSYQVNEGAGAFYGPKIDFHIKDSIGRTWQCGTIQLDFQLPLRFQAEYIGADGKKHRPIMIHRVVYGSLERFIGILIEHYDGKFPLWLSPIQIKILTVSNKYLNKVKRIFNQLTELGFRVEIDDREEKLGYKIREARLDKVPYMLIIGQKEIEKGSISVRSRDYNQMGSMSLNDFVEFIKEESIV
ncbi:threonine--tRNA ligase [Anaerosacchariphilus polymeriproducens]|uniref:Threonine--tRNA ligase n=1 Tax=Anaerosacchariphilus polymeriproducens TaxID=1812858 RepID=A0A371AZH5_9FIRM|nr:threonine--tRNA ligase [Anaerosacchariphilus polymeriproducens]RDU24880.1 threonine--tRNA ligase [Anaerosacchariphilus polymeriproducens]